MYHLCRPTVDATTSTRCAPQAFMSTTRDREVAVAYATSQAHSRGVGAQLVFEFLMGAVACCPPRLTVTLPVSRSRTHLRLAGRPRR